MEELEHFTNKPSSPETALSISNANFAWDKVKSEAQQSTVADKERATGEAGAQNGKRTIICGLPPVIWENGVMLCVLCLSFCFFVSLFVCWVLLLEWRRGMRRHQAGEEKE